MAFYGGGGGISMVRSAFRNAVRASPAPGSRKRRKRAEGRPERIIPVDLHPGTCRSARMRREARRKEQAMVGALCGGLLAGLLALLVLLA
jgi:hypothetical protein